MTAKKKIAKRGVRSPVTPTEVKGFISKTRDGAVKSSDTVLFWNVSDRGLCIWVTDHYKNGDDIFVTFTSPVEKKLHCKVRWSRTIPDRSGCLLGLEAVEESCADLETLHRELLGRSQKSG